MSAKLSLRLGDCRYRAHIQQPTPELLLLTQHALGTRLVSNSGLGVRRRYTKRASITLGCGVEAGADTALAGSVPSLTSNTRPMTICLRKAFPNFVGPRGGEDSHPLWSTLRTFFQEAEPRENFPLANNLPTPAQHRFGQGQAAVLQPQRQKKHEQVMPQDTSGS